MPPTSLTKKPRILAENAALRDGNKESDENIASRRTRNNEISDSSFLGNSSLEKNDRSADVSINIAQDEIVSDSGEEFNVSTTHSIWFRRFD